ncbi:hypothetical protein J5N97_006860 [Dioscorea zingiberensis]|uniref:Uncharacterized protein n=1 Tax=Dioscorea zingiberensis TaxID=325984 RepID=A0A9D5HTP9_9LILI|nr:hypothetical protein J5N97_006860 [Dioscorea zingiberensis]
MNSDTPLDCAVFQLSPRRSRCELFVSSDGKSEKIASGFFKPFASHLRFSEEQAQQSIKLEVGKQRNAVHWFNKGTLERFVRFVSTPELLELANTFDAEMSQLEGARKIYSQGAGDQLLRMSGENEAITTATSDATKKELLRAINVRLVAVKQDLTMACARVTAAGFTLDNAHELCSFAVHFGAHRLNEACNKFISLCQRRPELICNQYRPPSWKDSDDGNVRSSSGSDMSIDEPEVGADIQIKQLNKLNNSNKPMEPTQEDRTDPATMFQGPKFVQQHLKQSEVEKVAKESPSSSAEASQLGGGGISKRLSVQDRISLFESKQREQSTTPNSSNSGISGSTNRMAVGKAELRRLSSDVSGDKSVLRRWSGASDMSIDLNNSSSGERKGSDSATATPSSSANSQSQYDSKFEPKEAVGLKDNVTLESSSGSQEKTVGTSSSSSCQIRAVSLPRYTDQEVVLKEQTSYNAWMKRSVGKEQRDTKPQFGTSGKADLGGLNDQIVAPVQLKTLVNPVQSADLKHQKTIVLPEQGGGKEQATLQIPSQTISPDIEHVRERAPEDFGSQPEHFCTSPGGVRGKEQSTSTSVTQLKVFPRTKQVGRKSKGISDSQIQIQTSLSSTEGISTKVDPVTSQSHLRTTSLKLEETTKKETSVSGAPFEGNSGFQGMTLRRQTSIPNQSKNPHGSRIVRKPTQGIDTAVFSGTKANQSLESLKSPSATSVELVQTVRPLKGNHEMNDELQMKADELEKLFAAHKLKTHGDQLVSSRRDKPADVPKVSEKQKIDPHSDQLMDVNQVIGNTNNGGEMEFDANLLLKMVDNLDSINSMKQKLGGLSPSDGYRGKFYEKYMKKRDAKLREEWGSKKAQKEAKMKAMHDSLERSQAEMRAKFAVASRQDLTLAHLRAEKLRSFCNRSNLKNKDQIVICSSTCSRFGSRQ